MPEVCRYLIIQVCVLYLLHIRNSQSEMITVENKTCSMTVQLNENSPKTIEWDGRPLQRHCRVSFNISYERGFTFIDVEKFQVEDCGFQLLYFHGITRTPKKNYSCFSTPKQDIIVNENHIYIQFETYEKSRSKVKLLVSTEEHHSSSPSDDHSEDSVNTVLSALVFVLILAMVFCILYMYKKGLTVRKVTDNCLKCCGQCGRRTVECCDCSFIRTSDSGNATVTEQHTLHQSRRTSSDHISFSGVPREEPSAPPRTESTSPDDPPPPYECPPPPYLAVVKYVPPPFYLK